MTCRDTPQAQLEDYLKEHGLEITPTLFDLIEAVFSDGYSLGVHDGMVEAEEYYEQDHG